MSSSMSAIPRWFAATCAARSLRLSRSFRVPGLPSGGFVSSAVIPSSMKTPPSTSLNVLIAAPSSASVLENGGIDPGVIPPTSAWCPRDATKKTHSPSLNTGVITDVPRVQSRAFIGAVPPIELPLHRAAHRAEVHGDVRRVGDEAAVGAEQRAAEVQTLFDVRRRGRALQRSAHLLRDAHEPVVEYRQLDRVWGLVCVLFFFFFFGRRFVFFFFDRRLRVFFSLRGGRRVHVDRKVAELGHGRDAPGLDDARRGAVHHHRGASDRVFKLQCLREKHRRLRPLESAFEVHLRDAVRLGERLVVLRDVHGHAREQRRAPDAAHADVVDDDVSGTGEVEPVLSAEALAERGDEIEIEFEFEIEFEIDARVAAVRAVSSLSSRRHDRRVRALVPQVQQRLRRDVVHREALRREFRHHARSELVRRSPRRSSPILGQRGRGERPLRLGDDVREPHAVRGQDPAEPVHEHASHAERARDSARVLRPRAAERRERVRRGLDAFALRDFANRPAHRLVRDAHVPERDFLRGQLRLRIVFSVEPELEVDRIRLRLERASNGIDIQRLVLGRAEYLWKIRRRHPPQQRVGVRHGQLLPALAITHRPGLRPDGFRADAKRPRSKRQLRPAPRGDGRDVQLRRLNRHPRGSRLRVVPYKRMAGWSSKASVEVERRRGRGMKARGGRRETPAK
eukprot:30817-Pelagococcus_subviridis.AAC.1